MQLSRHFRCSSLHDVTEKNVEQHAIYVALATAIEGPIVLANVAEVQWQKIRQLRETQ